MSEISYAWYLSLRQMQQVRDILESHTQGLFDLSAELHGKGEDDNAKGAGLMAVDIMSLVSHLDGRIKRILQDQTKSS